jgi:uncharacterized cupredoxin-like copper-binding protein
VLQKIYIDEKIERDILDLVFATRYPADAGLAKIEAAQRDQFETIPVDQLPPGGAATLVLDEPGIYPYYCSLHGSASAGMVGRIRVAQD